MGQPDSGAAGGEVPTAEACVYPRTLAGGSRGVPVRGYVPGGSGQAGVHRHRLPEGRGPRETGGRDQRVH